MITQFNEVLAVEFRDVEVAILIENIAHWIRVNASKENPAYRNFHEGRFWTFNSLPELCKLFPVWSPRTIRTVIDRAIKAGLLIKGNFNKKKFDKTSWYTLTDKGLSYFPILERIIMLNLDSDNQPSVLGDSDRARDGIDMTIPITTTSVRNIINNITSSGTNSDQKPKKPKKARKPDIPKQVIAVTIQEMADEYREAFPDNPQPHPSLMSARMEKTLRKFRENYPLVEPNGKPLTRERFRRYLEALKESAPKFSLGSYLTPNGTRKKNGLDVIGRFETLMGFMEERYS